MSMQGGGSAYVEPHRSASLLSAVRALSSADVSFSPGCRIFREPPPLREGLSVLIDGTEMAGALVSYFNSPEFEGEAALQQRRRRMHVVWLGEPVPGKIEGQFSARVTANYTAAESGLHRFTLVSAGRSRVFIDDHCVVDNWDQWERGTSFYGAGSTMVEGSISLEAGRSSTMVLEYSAPETPGVRGVTLGCMPPDTTDLIDQAVAVAGSVDAVVLVVGTTGETEKEGTDRTTLQLPGEQDELVRRVLAANPRTVVVVNAGSPVAMPWVADAPAVLWTWFPGQQGDEAVADILFGQKDPGGRLPMTMPVRVEDCPAHATYPGQDGTVTYSDDVFVGYRGYRRHGVTPLYPFGHGLSYTEFRLEPMVLDRTALRAGEPLTVTVGISNVGQRTGSHVVQLYVGDTESRLPRPDRELKGFAKVQLAPGERTEVTFNLGLRSFAAWDPEVRDWLVEPGEFEVMIGSSSADISQSRTVTCLDPIGASAPDQS
jgi:beta-glucosidase